MWGTASAGDPSPRAKGGPGGPPRRAGSARGSPATRRSALGPRLEAQEGQFLGRPLLRAERRRLQGGQARFDARSEEHTSELQSHLNLVCRLLLEKKKI